MTKYIDAPAVKSLIESLPPDDFREVILWIVTVEKRRREQVASEGAARVEMVKLARQNDPSLQPVPREDGVYVWESPSSIFAAYLPGEIVAHGEKLWKSVHSGPNESEPGVGQFWAEHVPTPEPQPAASDKQDVPDESDAADESDATGESDAADESASQDESTPPDTDPTPEDA